MKRFAFVIVVLVECVGPAWVSRSQPARPGVPDNAAPKPSHEPNSSFAFGTIVTRSNGDGAPHVIATQCSR